MQTTLPRIIWASGLVLMAAALMALASGFISGYRAQHEPACEGIACNVGASLEDTQASVFWFKAAAWTAVVGIVLAFAGNLWIERIKRADEQST